jgi:TonB family protein
LTGKEHAAAVHRWDDMRFPSRPWPFGKAGELPLKMTLADLPAGMAQAVFQDHECKMPRQALLASARVSYGSTGRPASVELMQMKVGRECHEAVILLLRAGLSPDDARPPLPAQALTVYVPLGGGQETRFDEIPPGDEPSVMDGDIIPPHRHHFVKPAYPEEMRQARTEGKVVMLMVVDRDGVPGNIRLLESADARFDRSAVHAVTQWRYKPALRDGVPLNALLTVIVDYNLR